MSLHLLSGLRLSQALGLGQAVQFPFLAVFPARLSTVSNFCGSLRSFLKYVHREDKISQDEQEHEELGRLK